MSEPAAAADDARLAGALFAIDPPGLGGVRLRAAAGPARDAWLARLKAWLPAGAPWRRIPLHVTDSRLLGGLDLAGTLAGGRRVAERGLLAEADGGVAVLAMAERVEPSTAVRLAQVLDTGEVAVERDGIAARHPTRFGLVVLDEGLEDERPPEALLERLAFELALDALRPDDFGADADALSPAVVAAREILPRVQVDEAIVTALATTALALGVPSLRATWFATRAARAAAALRTAVERLDESARAGTRPRGGASACVATLEDAALAARLVLAPRATQVPATEESQEPEPSPDAEPEPEPPPPEPPAHAAPPPEGAPPEPPPAPPPAPDSRLPDDLVLAAALAAIPPGLLARLQAQGLRTRAPQSQGRSGAARKSGLRGRPAGVRRGLPRPGVRLHVVETLRAAAPWQKLRRREALAAASANATASAYAVAPTKPMPSPPSRRRVEVRADDFHVARFLQRSETTTIFVVDASGSSALARLAEAKGAVELLLADCYVRRDRVALVAFRGRGAELLLPPTRSLVRAKRSLAALPGGGGTPLASGLDAALALAEAVQRRGGTPTLVLLTDGRANVARDGTPGRPRAQDDALISARRARASGVAALVVDTSTRPEPAAQRLAEAMRARYVPLPHADARAVNAVVRATVAGASTAAASRR